MQGQCVSKCNPLCGEGERCTDEGECEAIPASSRPAPSPAPDLRRHDQTSPAGGEAAHASVDGETASGCALPAGDRLAEQRPGVRRHDGFFLRLGVGPSSYYGAEYPSGMAVGGALEFALGGTVGRGVVVGAMTSPKVLNTMSDSSLENVVFTFLGPFVDYYPDPAKGFHLLGGAGVATVRTYSSDLTATAEVLAGAGHEWWVGEQWSVGLLGRVSVLPVESLGASPLYLFNGMVSFTYH